MKFKDKMARSITEDPPPIIFQLGCRYVVESFLNPRTKKIITKHCNRGIQCVDIIPEDMVYDGEIPHYKRTRGNAIKRLMIDEDQLRCEKHRIHKIEETRNETSD